MTGCPYCIGSFHVTELFINSAPGKIIADVVRVTSKHVYGACTFILTILNSDRILQHSLREDICATPVRQSTVLGIRKEGQSVTEDILIH